MACVDCENGTICSSTAPASLPQADTPLMEAGGAITTWISRPPFASSSIFRRNFNFPASSTSFSRISISRFPPSTCNPTTFHVLHCSPQARFGEDRAGGDEILISDSVLTLGKGLLNIARANFLPLALIGAVALGMICPALGSQASRYPILKFSTFGIFLISGLKLSDGEVGEIRKAWPAVIYGLASILLFCPLFSRLILKVQLVPQEFSTGLAIFSCMPTTLTSGVALTQIAGGNSALALFLTVMSNTLGIFIVPLWVSKFLADGFGVSIPIWQMFQSLFIMLLVPLVLGKVCRNSFHGLARYADQNQKALSMTSTFLLSLTPWIQVSKSRSLLMIVELKVFLAAIMMGIVVHLVLLALNAFSVKCMSAGFGNYNSVFANKRNARALILVCSQKALLIAVTVVEQLGGALGDSGLLVLPCVAAHINQVIIDSFLVNFWLQKDKKVQSK